MTLVIQTEDLDAGCAEWLASRCEVVRCGHEEAGFGELLSRASGVVVRTYTPVDEAFLSGAPLLRVVGRAGVALENVDVGACVRRGVRVVHTPESNTSAVVEFVNAVLMDAVRPRVFVDEAIEASRWHAMRRELVGERELNELTLGVLGHGRIGSRVARLGAVLGMRVVAHDLGEVSGTPASPVGLEELCRESDVLSVHVDYRSSNRGLVGERVLGWLKEDALLINTSRGFVVDAAALASRLRGAPGMRALIDVHDPYEPIPAGYPLLGVENAYLTPHLASGTVKAKRDMSWVVRDVWRVLEGGEPAYPPPGWLLAEVGG